MSYSLFVFCLWGRAEFSDTDFRATCSVMGFHPDDRDEAGSIGELYPNCEGKVCQYLLGL